MKRKGTFLLALFLFSVLNSYAQDSLPKFPGGMTELMKYISYRAKWQGERSIRNGEGGFQRDAGVFKLFFDNTGLISAIKTEQAFSKADNQQILDILSSSPKWIVPHEINAVNIQITIFLQSNPQTRSYSSSYSVQLFNPVIGDISTNNYESPVVIDSASIYKTNAVYSKLLARTAAPYFALELGKKKYLKKNVLCLLRDSLQQGEFVWLEAVKVNKDTILCLLSEQPQSVKGYKKGNYYKCQLSQLYHWDLISKQDLIGFFNQAGYRNKTINDADGELRTLLNTKAIVNAYTAAVEEVSHSKDAQFDTLAKYPDGEERLLSFLRNCKMKNRVFRGYSPAIGIDKLAVEEDPQYEDPIYCSFFVMPDGRLLNPTVIIGGALEMQKDILRALNHAKKWHPAYTNGHKTISHVLLKI